MSDEQGGARRPAGLLSHMTSPSKNRAPLAIATGYLIVGILWIIFSDRLLVLLTSTEASLARWQTIKGWAYVLVTAILLYGIISRYTTRWLRVEKNLRESESRFRRAILRFPLPTLLHAEGGEILLVNEMWSEKSGYARDDLQTIADWTERVYGEQENKIRADIEKLYASDGRVDEGEYVITTRSGEERTWHFDSTPLGRLPDGRRLVLSVAEDVTERREMQDTLRESESRYRLLAETAQDIICIHDLDGHIQYLNKAGLDHLMGGDWQEFGEGKHIANYVVGAGQQGLEQRYTQRLAGDTSKYLYETQLINAQQEIVPVEISSAPIVQNGEIASILLVARDLTQRQETEKALRENERLLRTIIDATPNCVFVKDKRGRYILANETMAKLYGTTPEEMIGKTDEEFVQMGKIALEDTKPFAHHDESVIDRGMPTLNREISIRLAAGETHWLQMVKKPIAMPRDTEALLGVAIDITVRKQALDELERHRLHLEELVAERTTELEARVTDVRRLNRAMTNLLEDLQASNQRLEQTRARLQDANRELNDFAYVVSHDLKAPLRGITQLSNWIREDYASALDSDGQEMLELLVGRAKRMHDLIEGILQYSRVGRLRQREREIDLNEMVLDIVDLLAAPPHIKIDMITELPTVVGEEIRFRQVFQNLLSNAIKFMDKPQGRVTIACENQKTAWQFSVSDNGPGIAEKYYDKVFQIFQTLRPRDEYESTGVGLALVKKIVEAWGGRVWLDSTVGEGSTFYFTLPKQ